MNRCWVDFNDVFKAGDDERVTTLAQYCDERPQVGDKVQAHDSSEYLRCDAEVLDVTESVFRRGTEIVLLRLHWPPRDLSE